MLAVIGKSYSLGRAVRGSSGKSPWKCSSVKWMHPSILWSSFCSTSWVYDYDVAVVGGGVVGASVAASLAQTIGRTGAKIALIEAGKGPSSLAEALEEQIPDPRVFSFTPTSEAYMREIGVWDRISKHVTPFSDIQVWDTNGISHMAFNAKEAGAGKYLGYIVENSKLQAALFERLRELKVEGSLELITESGVEGMSFPGWKEEPHSPASLTLKGQRKIRDDGDKSRASSLPSKLLCRVVVAADGGNSLIRLKRGLITSGLGYGQRALVATLRTDSKDASHIAWQRFLPSGPVALLPLSNVFSSLVWSCSYDEAEDLLSLSDVDFVKRLNDAFRGPPTDAVPPPERVSGGSGMGGRLLRTAMSMVAEGTRTVSALSNVDPRSSSSPFSLPPMVTGLASKRFGFDLNLKLVSQYVAPRLALVGDAAHTIHPMAGLGLNLGLQDAKALSDILREGVESGIDIGSLQQLKTYENQRKKQNEWMAVVLQGVHWLFGSSEGSRAVLRGAGMGAINALPITLPRRVLARYAMGLGLD